MKRAVHPPAFSSDAFFCFTIVEMQKDEKKGVDHWQLPNFRQLFFGSDAKIPRRPFCGICGGQNPAVVAAKRKFLPDEVGEVFLGCNEFSAVWVGTLVLPGNSAIVTFFGMVNT